MTDITEMAQREKFEAWVMTQICISKSTLEGLRTSDGYRNSTLSGSDYNLMWNLWKAAGYELVEALEKAQTINAAAEKLVRCKGRYHSEQNYRALAALFGVNTPDLPPLEHENVHYADAAEMEIAALRQRIAELESRTVTVKLPEPPGPMSVGARTVYFGIVADVVSAFQYGITTAGIKVEVE